MIPDSKETVMHASEVRGFVCLKSLLQATISKETMSHAPEREVQPCMCFVSIHCAAGSGSCFKQRNGRVSLSNGCRMLGQARPNISFPRSGTSRAFNRGAVTRRSYIVTEKKKVVSFYLQHCREHGEVVDCEHTKKHNKTKTKNQTN